MTEIEYDELNDDYYFVCGECGATGRGWMAYRDAERDADHHDDLHDDGVI